MNVMRIVTPSGEVVLEAERDHVIGRGRDCDVVMSDGRVSRRHLRLESTADGWLARDISSSGIWVDGSRASVVPLRGGEVRVRLGAADGPAVTLIPPPPPAPAAPPAPVRGAAAPFEPDVSDQETMLAGSGAPTGGLPRPPASAVGAPTGAQPVRVGGLAGAGAGGPAASGGAGPSAGSGSSAGSVAGWLKLVPTLVWLACVGFFLGALLALS